MLRNVFSQGINPGSAKVKVHEEFPYDIDNLQKPIHSFAVKKTFDTELQRWKTSVDLEKDKDPYVSINQKKREKLQSDQVDMTVDFSFNVNHVRLNSGLNADFMDVLGAEKAT